MLQRSTSSASFDATRRPTGSLRRCGSADSGLDTFTFPDGSGWSLPATWGVREYILHCRTSFKTYAYRSLEHGDKWVSEEGPEIFEVPDGNVRDDIPLKCIEKPVRAQATPRGWFVDQERLFSVLEAMVTGKPLPPVRISTDGPARVMNGFHRYYASLLLGYKELPVLREIRLAALAPLEEETQAEDNGPDLTFEDEDGTLTCVKTSVLAPKAPTRAAVRQTQPMSRTRGHEVEKTARWEPPAKRREREEREERERQAQLKRDMAKTLQEDISRKQTRNMALSQRMRSPPFSYAQVTARPMGRKT